MYSHVELTGAPSFSNSAESKLSSLGSCNFVYGPNGTGKTTISRVIDNPGLHGAGGPVVAERSAETRSLVYNRDYVLRTLQEADRLAGVFVLDDESPEERLRYNALTSTDGLIEQASEALGAVEKKLGAIEAQITSARTSLTDAAWTARSTMPDELNLMFRGYKSSKAVFLEKLLSVTKADARSQEDLLRDARSAFDDSGSSLPFIPSPPDRSPFSLARSNLLLNEPVLGSTEVTLAHLIERLDNQDWVSNGRKYASDSTTCPFCQQSLPKNFLVHLSEYFDDDYSRKKTALQRFQSDAQEFSSAIKLVCEALQDADAAVVASPERDATVARIQTALTKYEERIAKKVRNPAHSVESIDLHAELDELEGLVDSANLLIKAHNDRISNRTRARTKLAAECWTYFAWDVVKSEMASYARTTTSAGARRTQVQAEVAGARHRLTELEQEASLLETSLVSSVPAITRVNRILEAVGFRRFQLAKSDAVKDGYRLQRPDGEIAAETMSDGERTFIAFLYYFAQLESKHKESGRHALVAVIDDPISSLDSDVLFVVSNLIRRLAGMINEGSGSLCQLIVLTHNVQFHNEITYERMGDKRSGALRGRRFYELRRDNAGDTIVVASDQNNIRSNYQRLWKAVQEATQSTETASVGLENVLRRILENYFTVIGYFPNLDELIETSDQRDAIVYRSLLAWLHHGSHALVDDFDYSPSGIGTQVYLRVFKDMFEQTGQLGHYDMMMEIDTSEPEFADAE